MATREIVLLPGLDGTGELFARLESYLASELDVTIVRYPDDPSLGYAGYETIVRQAIGSRKVMLLGESFSGPVAVCVAATLGRQIEAVLLAATFLKNPWPSWIIRRATSIDPQATPAKFRDRILMGAHGDPELQEKVEHIVQTLPRPVRAARLRAVAEVDVRKKFRALNIPVLALHGRNDWLVRKTPIQRAISRKGGARMIVLPAAHMLLQTRARECAGEILSFARSCAVAEEKK